MDDETQVLERARAGDPDAWELVYRRAYPGLIAYASRRLAAPEQAEEAVSETMVRAMDMIDGYRPTGAGVQAWLFGIARNVVLEAYRAGTRQFPADPATLSGAAGRAPGADAASAGPWPGTVGPPSTDPLTVMLNTEQRRVLADAFDRLSDTDQQVLELRVLAGLDAEEVGELTGRRAGAVRTAQSRALARLRVEFEELMA